MTTSKGRFPIAPGVYMFAQLGQAGRWVSALFHHTARLADERCAP